MMDNLGNILSVGDRVHYIYKSGGGRMEIRQGVISRMSTHNVFLMANGYEHQFKPTHVGKIV